MKFFLDRHKTLLPRVDVIYLLTRTIILLSLGWYVLSGRIPGEDHTLFYFILGTFAVHLAFFFIAMKGKFDIKLGYLSAIVYDLILVPFLVSQTVCIGDAYSPFFPLFFVTVSVAAYVLTFWFSLAATIAVTLSYAVSVYSAVTVNYLFDVFMRIGFIWVYHFAILYASDYMRRSEGRLLKLFNTLNMRTSELEKSQAHFEMIYENTRILASILEPDAVVKEVMRIMGSILQYRAYAVIFKDKWGNFYYRARFQGGQNNFHLKAIDVSRMELIKKVADIGESIIVKDTLSRDDVRTLDDGTRSLMIVPMTSHAHTNGLLTAESDEVNHFSDRDLQMLSVVARSAALALENSELHKKTEELTIIDELTEAYNYRYFVQKLQEEKRRASRYDLPLSLIMVDIDWFKKLNDTYGHEVGNFVLRKLSGIIQRCIRDVDVFARYGGEEFAIILPQTQQREAAIIAERIREEVEKEVFEARQYGKLKVTVSVGVSSYPENGKSQEELVAVADQALYQAKGEGKNAVCVI
ncbi:MAG: sensor domain-containing diguanylate cyclase [Candidatus Zixiibacteriota bacterium]|nr:MAG: sensor domain-containing diguanylate cyclase [candidate division Zixibacteria bacterium]